MKQTDEAGKQRAFLPPRSRFRMTELGRERHPYTRSYRGVILHANATGSAYVVLLDGAKTHTTLHHSYVEAEQQTASLKRDPRADY
jgi:hypothetical protein